MKETLPKGAKVNKWTDEELKILEDLHSKRIPVAEIAKQMNRPKLSVSRKINWYIAEKYNGTINDPDIARRVKEGYERGDIYQKIGDDIGITRQSVRRILKKMGLTKRKKTLLNTGKYTPEEHVKLVKKHYLDQDLSIIATSKATGFEYQYVDSIIRSYNLRKKPCDWTEEQFQLFFQMLEAGNSLFDMCCRLNKTDRGLEFCAKYFNIYDKYPVLHFGLPKKQKYEIMFLMSKINSINRYDGKHFEKQNLTLQNIYDLWKKQDGKCFYTGKPMEIRSNCRNSVSVERLDSDKPHSLENIVLCTCEANCMKQDLDIYDFLDVATAIHSRKQVILDELKARANPPPSDPPPVPES